MKLRYLFLLIVLTFLAGIWAARTQLAEFAISSVMQDAGLSNVTADIEQFGSSQSHLSRFEFSLVNETGRFQFAAHGINIHYKLEQLTTGRVNSVTVDKLVLHYESSGNAQDDSSTAAIDVTHEALEPLKIIVALKKALREYVIFNSLSVQQISMHGKSFAALQDKTLRLNSTNKDDLLYAELTLLDQSSSEQKNNLRQFVITKLSQDFLSAELRFSATADSIPARLELNINDSDTADTLISGNYHIDPAQLQHWLQPLANINGFKITEKIKGTISVKLDPENKIISTLTANSKNLIFNHYSASNVTIKLILNNATSNPLQLTKLQNGSYIKFGHFNDDNLSLAGSRINMVGELSTSADTWNYNGGLSANAFAVNYESQVVKLKDIAARVTANSKKLDVDGNFSPATVPGKFAFSLAHHFTQKPGQLVIKPLQAIDLNAENNKLSLLLTPWPYPFDLLTGKIKLSSHATWSEKKRFQLTAKINIQDGGGTMAKEIVFSGLTLDHELELLPKLHSIRKSKISLKHLDSGVTTSNIASSLTLKTASAGPLPQFAIQGLRGDIFGGSFSSNDFIFDLNRNKNNFRIKATNIDLAEIIETQQLEDIVVTGRVDGTIPVEINEQGIFIEHGALVNDVRAGTIRYNPGAATDQLKQNPLTGIALDALKDFRYSHLSADVNFTPDGTLTINLQLKGTSPELDTDRPVHLNINTEQNLTKLLKSLRFAQGVSENIDKKVRQQYEKTKTKN